MGTIYAVDGDDLTAIANKIRTKGGTSSSLEFPTGFEDAVDAIQTGITPTGTKNITSNGNNQDVVGYAAVNVSVPNSYSASDEGKVVSNGALVSQSSDTCTSNGVVDTTLINSLTVDVSGGVISLDDWATGDYPNGAISLSGTSVIGYAFYNRPYLTDLNVPNLTSIGDYAFGSCARLGTVNLKSFSVAGTNNYIFSGSGGTSRNAIVVLPAITNIGSRMFRNAYIDTVDIGAGCTNINADTFYTTSTATNPRTIVCDKLILRKSDAIVTASNTDAIKGLKDVYVPSALKSTYEGATNWVTKVSQGHITFHAIEGSIYEHAYADGTPIT